MKKTPFKLKSGNTTPFKQMGSSPMKIDMTKVKGSATYVSEADRAKQQIASVMAPKIAETKTVKTPPPPKKSTTSTTSYSEAYKKADKSKYKTEAEFTTAAKAWNTKKYGTTEPTREAKTLKRNYSDVTDIKSGKAKLAKTQVVRKSNKAITDKNDTRVASEQKVKSDAIKKDMTTATTKKRTKTGKLGVAIGNIFRKKGKKKNPYRK